MSGRLLVVVAAALSTVACSSARKPQNAPDPGSAQSALATCTGCHGSAANGNAAPPNSVVGATATTDVRVGAHQQHLTVSANSVRQPLSCSECHVVPTSIDFPGHIDGDRAELRWGPLARADGAAPTPADGTAPAGTTLTCTNYCHGATLGGGTLKTPQWTVVNRTQAGCGTCHGIPPPPPHPVVAATSTSCSACHGETIRPDGTINLAGGRHINGIVDLVGGTEGCTLCHGDATRTPAQNAPAPPRDTAGNAATTAPGVGAHQRHLTGGTIRASLACAACHTVPADLSHINGQVDHTWSPLAQNAGVTPSFNATTLTCTNYCHGGALSGGSNQTPVWNAANQATCGSCHGIPPPSPHPPVASDRTQCGVCHPGTVKADGNIDTAGGKHINGSPDVVGTSCTSCHGDAGRGGIAAIAPPRDVAGNTATTVRTVGAHQAHVTASALSGPIACGECHTVPTDLSHAVPGPGSPPKVNFDGELANAGGATPSFNTTALTCTNYCHGQTLAGGARTTPTWTAGAGEAACGNCHGVPPATGRHVTVEEHRGVGCAVCHGPGYAPTTVNAALHVNGVRDAGGTGTALSSYNPATTTCTALCHGDARTWRP